MISKLTIQFANSLSLITAVVFCAKYVLMTYHMYTPAASDKIGCMLWWISIPVGMITVFAISYMLWLPVCSLFSCIMSRTDTFKDLF